MIRFFRLIRIGLISAFILMAGCRSKNSEVIQIGAILPLTGSLSEIGNDEKLAIELALEQFDKGHSVQVVYKDSKGNVNESLSAAAQLINQGIKKIILSTTPVVIANLEKYKNREDILFIAQCMSPKFLENYENAIRIYNSVDLETDLISQYIKSQKMSKLGIIYINNDFGQSAISELESKLNSIISFHKETFSFQEKNYQNQIAKIIQFNPDALIVYSYPQQWPNIVKQLEQSGYNGKILANSGLSFLLDDLIGSSISQNYIVPLPSYIYEENNIMINNFKDLLSAKTSKSANYDILYFYDMMNILLTNILENPNLSNQELLQQIVSKSYIGVSGTLEFNERDVQSLDLKLVNVIDISRK